MLSLYKQTPGYVLLLLVCWLYQPNTRPMTQEDHYASGSKKISIPSLQSLAINTIVTHDRMHFDLNKDVLPDDICTTITRNICAHYSKKLQYHFELDSDQTKAPDEVAFNATHDQIALLYARNRLLFFDAYTGQMRDSTYSKDIHGFDWHPQGRGYLTVGKNSIFLYDCSGTLQSSIPHTLMSLQELGLPRAYWNTAGTAVIVTSGYACALIDPKKEQCLRSSCFPCFHCCAQATTQLANTSSAVDDEVRCHQTHAPHSVSNSNQTCWVSWSPSPGNACQLMITRLTPEHSKHTVVLPFAITHARWSPCNRWIVCIGTNEQSHESQLLLIDSNSLDMVSCHRVPTARLTELEYAWNPQYPLLAVYNGKHPISLIDPKDTEPLYKIYPPSSYSRCVWSKDGTRLAVICKDARIIISDVTPALVCLGATAHENLLGVLALTAPYVRNSQMTEEYLSVLTDEEIKKKITSALLARAAHRE